MFLAIVRLLLALAASTSATGPYLKQQDAIDLNAELINVHQFRQEQLSELAGRSAASAIAHVYRTRGKVLVICGPGNNGADGLVCARHLKIFGFQPVVYYPYPRNETMHQNLVAQCQSMNITMLKRLPIPKVRLVEQQYMLIVDALFGVRFKRPVRHNYLQLLENMWEVRTPLASIDVPSGWHVDLGPNLDDIRPQFLISIGAPKMCAKFFAGRYHYLGGRFIPPVLQQKYNLTLPAFHKDEIFMQLHAGPEEEPREVTVMAF